MKPEDSIPPGDISEEVTALINALHDAQQRLEVLTGGEIDTVADRDGRTFLLRRAQEQLRHSEAAKQAAILNALPAHIALLDARGCIVSVNEAWRRFTGEGAVHGPGHAVGLNYPEICASAWGEDSAAAHQSAEGVRSVLEGRASSYTLEYASHLPSARFWYQMTVTPLADEGRNGAVVMHLDVTERKAAEIRIKRLNRVYAVLSGINTLIVRVRSREELLGEACRIAVEAGAFRMAWIGTLDQKSLDGKVAAWHGGEKSYLDMVRLTLRDGTPDSDRPGSRAMRELRPVICNDIATDESVRPLRGELLKRGHKSAACFPLTVAGRAEGVICLFAGEPGVFDAEETRLLVELAGDISLALEHIEKAAKLARLTRVNAMLSGINAAIVRIRDRQELFQEACRIAVETGGLPFAWICVVDEAGMCLRLAASAGADPAFLDTIGDRLSLRDDAPAGHGIGARAVREKRGLAMNNVEADSYPKYRKSYAERGIKSIAAFPLLVAGRAVASFALHAAEVDFFDDDEMRLLNEMAANIAFALEHMEREVRLQRLTRVHAVLSGINTLIVRVRDREELFREACRIAVDVGHFAKAWVGIVDRGSRQFAMVAAHGGDPTFFRDLEKELVGRIRAGRGFVVRALDTRQPVIVNDMASDPDVLLKDAATAGGARSLAMLPLVVSGEAVGVFTLNADEPEYFDAEEMTLLAELAGDIAYALDHLDKQDRLDYLAYYDSLTGLANRSLFLERVAQYMRGAVSGGHKLALFFLDLERFRNINDSLGRPAGDLLLRQVADWLTRSTSNSGLLGYLGADHFAIVLPEVKQEGDIAQLLEKRVRAFLDHPFRVNETELRIATKVGVAVFPNDGTDAETLLKNAEAALKIAKAKGEKFLFYTQAMSEKVAGQLTLENQLRRALGNGEFVLHYQPKLGLATGKLTGAEALIRWNDPQTGLVPPGRFIPILEETGLIHDVGRWALRKALEDYLRWRAAGLPAVRVAVNVSPLQLRNRGFVGEISRIIGIDAKAAAGLELEITESLIMENVKHSIASLQAIRAMGVTIAIDDFGTGFSSLSYLAKLPVDKLKIDRSFIVDMMAGPDGLALVSTIISLAHSLRLGVVAEGVETEEQSRLLRLLDCDEMQGFLFSKPLPAEEFEARFLGLPVAA